MEASQNTKLEEILITNEQINKAIIKAAEWIDETYKKIEGPIVLIGLLKGCIPFLGQLLTKIKRDVILDFMVVSSFKGSHKRKSDPVIVTDIISNIENMHILFIEDIIDSGLTIQYTMNKVFEKNPASMKLISLLDKPSGRVNNFNADYVCFEIEDKFVVGFGLDYKEMFRNYDSVAVLSKKYID